MGHPVLVEGWVEGFGGVGFVAAGAFGGGLGDGKGFVGEVLVVAFGGGEGVGRGGGFGAHGG